MKTTQSDFHGEPGHLNAVTRDHNSVITAFGQHARVVACQPDGEGLYARVDLRWPELREPTAAEVLTVARKHQGVRGKWVVDSTRPPEKYESNGCERIEYHFIHPEELAAKLETAAPRTQQNPEQEQQAGEVATGSMSPAVAFFYNNAGYSYGPDQTPAEGRLETAQALANAEARASEAGVCFEWERDVMDAAEWDCAAILGDDILASLGGVDFGKGGEPDANQPYRRVVEAELALEALDAITAALARA